MIGEIIKNGAISLGIAIVIAFAISYFLELSPEGTKNITFISIVICLALGQGIRFIWARIGSKKMKPLFISFFAIVCCVPFGHPLGKESIKPQPTPTPRAETPDASTKKSANELPMATPDANKKEAPFPRLATRGYLYTEQPTPGGYGAYAYVVFNGDPQRIENQRCLAVCEAFNGYLPEHSASDPERKYQMVTFWPMRGSFVSDAPNCQQLIANYDHRFAARIAASVRKQGVHGPPRT